MAYKVIKYKILTILVFISILSSSLIKANNIPTGFPSWFVKNLGQFNNNSKYSLKSSYSNTFFFDQYIVHQFITPKDKSDTLNPGILNVRIDFENSNPHPTFQEREPQSARSSFFSGNDASKWKTDIPLFGSLAYQNIYNNIDLVYYNSANSKKSDFVVHTGGNYKDISLKYSGITGILINPQGVLQIRSDAGDITEQIPEAYQLINGKKILVKADFVVEDSFKVKFDIQEYDPAYDLVIDPQLIYSSFFGGTNDEFWPTNIVRDSQQNIYFGGRTTSSDFPTTPGAYSRTYTGDFDAFVLKLDPTGKKLIFSTYFGGTGQDLSSTIHLVGSAEDIMVVGLASGGGFPTTAGAYQTVYGGYADDMFVLKLNNAGNNLIFSTLVGGPYDEQGGDFCLDKNGDIYVLGYAGPQFPTTPGAYQQTNTGDYDLVVFKLSGDGKKLLYSTYIGGSERDRRAGIALDELSNVYITGWTLGDFPTTAGAFQRIFSGDIDMVACKFDPTLSNLIFSTLIGGPGLDITTSHLSLDKDNNLIFVGEAGYDFPTTAGSYDQSFNGGNTDCVIIKLKNDGTKLLYSSYLGGTDDDFARDFTINNSGNLAITGSCGNGFPVTKCTYDDTFNGGNTDSFLSVFNMNTSSLLYSTYLGGSGDEEGSNILASGDTLLLVGNTSSANLPVTADAFDYSYSGGPNDLFFIKFLPSSGEKPVATFNNSANLCLNTPVSFINNSVNGNSYKWDFGDGNSSMAFTPTHSFILAGEYKISLIAINSCSSDTTSALINVKGFLKTESVSICSNEAIFINGVLESKEGSYNTIFATATGCDSIIKINLYVNPIKIKSQNPVICEGELFEVGTHKYTMTGNYVDSFKTSLGCDSIITTHLTVNSPKQSIQNPTICEGEEFRVGSNIYTLEGQYSDALKTTYGCDSIVKTNLTIKPLPEISLGKDTFICPGNFILLDPGKGFATYLWSDGSDSIKLKVTKPGIYSVVVFDGVCSASDTIIFDHCGPELWFPNVFTPNNDGTNDTFRPVAQGIISSYHIIIFNRWGQQLYESNDAITGWDGTYNGNLCPDGVYYYITDYSTGLNPSNITQKVRRGAVTILR